MGFLKSLYNDIKKQAIEDANKPNRRERNDEKFHQFMTENSIYGQAKKIADEKGVSLDRLLEEVKRKMK